VKNAEALPVLNNLHLAKEHQDFQYIYHGGPSSALLIRKNKNHLKEKKKVIWGKCLD